MATGGDDVGRLVDAYEQAGRGRDTATLEATAQLVRLHARREGPIKDISCWEGDCEHDAGSCPVLAEAFCGHCAGLTDTDDEHVGAAAYWPCETMQQIEATYTARIERVIARLDQDGYDVGQAPAGGPASGQSDEPAPALPLKLPSPSTRQGSASLSACGTYRWTLHREWRKPLELPRWVTFVMLNPSTADADDDDPTIRRCIHFAKALGGTGLAVVNLYALRATDPTDLWTVDDPVGPRNDATLTMFLSMAKRADFPIVAAWGAHARQDRVQAVLAMDGAERLTALGVTKNNAPKHPLARGQHRIPDDATPAPWPGDPVPEQPTLPQPATARPTTGKVA